MKCEEDFQPQRTKRWEAWHCEMLYLLVPLLLFWVMT